MQKNIDICLLLEGTYPYVRGGVSSWVNQIIKGLPEFNFYLVFIGGEPNAYQEMLYELPKNVVDIEVNYLLNQKKLVEPRSRRGRKSHFKNGRRY